MSNCAGDEHQQTLRLERPEKRSQALRGRKPDNEYPGLLWPKVRQTPGGHCSQGSFLFQR